MPDRVPTQISNVRERTFDAFVTYFTKNFSLNPGALVSGGLALANAGAVVEDGKKAFACEAAKHWWALGERKTPDHSHSLNKCYYKQLETINWSKYDNFEAAWAEIQKKCL